MPAECENPPLTHADLPEVTCLVGCSQVLPYAYAYVFAKDTQVCLTSALTLTST